MAARSLRAVGLAITLVSVVAFSTIVYSAYADVSTIFSTLGSGSGSSAIAAREVVRGSTATVYLNVTMQNKGLYPVMMAISCLDSQGAKVTCNSPSVTVAPGTKQTLHFVMAINDFRTQGGTSNNNIHVNGTVLLALDQFASISIAVDLGSLAHQGGG
jgi:hypothetical protein